MNGSILDTDPRRTTKRNVRRLGLRTSGLLVLTGALSLITTIFAVPAIAATTFPVTGADVSWPQCPVGGPMPMPLSTAKFVVFGLTAGYAYSENPCLADQVSWANDRMLYRGAYSFTGLATRDERIAHGASGPYRPLTDLTNQYRNAGYYAATRTIKEMKTAGLAVPFVWLDIEPSAKRPWHTSKTFNRAFIEGQRRAYTRIGIETGFYLSASSFGDILGYDYALPEWRTVGPTTRTDALKRCNEPAIQGGTTVLSQWWTTQRDYDLICPKQRTWTKLKLYLNAP